MRRLATVLFATALLVTAGCSGGRDAAPTASGPSQGAVDFPLGPDGLDFYSPPPPPHDAAPGDLIWIRPLDSPPGADGFLLLYWSTASSGELIPVSGVMFRPVDGGGAPPMIVAWAEGTSGMADDCAPSRAYERGIGPPPSAQLARLTLDFGGVFVASDYEGLGTPGEHPYIAQRSAGRNVLDSIRAAAAVTGEGADMRAVVLGASQGGGAALMAAEQRSAYAPDVDLLGVVAIAPPSQLGDLHQQLDGGPYFGYVLMAIAGLEAAYPQLVAEMDDLTPTGRAAVVEVRALCGDEVLARFSHHTAQMYGADAVLGTEAFAHVLDDNDPGQRAPDVPVLIVHGERDDTIPVANTRKLVGDYCHHGAEVGVEYYRDHGHVDVLPAALTEIMGFVQSRLAGLPFSSACPTN